MNSTKRLKRDVIIVGGGLAGLSLAIQISDSSPDISIIVLERNSYPIPEKVSKVGESTVEIGSHYLKDTLGMKDHFTDRHLRKHGLRCFYGTPQSDFSDHDELGVSQLFGIPTYQIDRGAIENHLHSTLVKRGIEVWGGVVTSNLNLQGKEKSIEVLREGEKTLVTGNWIIDAAGRQALIKNKLDLAKSNEHQGNAVWFRVDRQIKIDEWSANEKWHERIKSENSRWLSTNHLMGPGYWVWVIPLDNGATSIGIVMDDEAFESHDFTNLDSTLNWLELHHPRCAQALDGADVLDYVVLRDYSYSCKQSISDQGWGMVGESGSFADPFYSPGSDFIAINNTFVQDLICKWHNGEDIRFPSRLYQTLNQSFFESTLSLYTGQYGGFGDRKLMSLKLVWDYAYYWGVLSLLFFKGALTDADSMRKLGPSLRTAQTVNKAIQARFRRRAEQRLTLPALGLFIDQYQVPCLRRFNNVLQNETQGVSVLQDNVAILERLATHIERLLEGGVSGSISQDESEILGDYRHSVLA